MNDDLSPETATTSSRRTVLTAAAWSAPVIAVAAATPFAAASRCSAQNVSLNWLNTNATGPIPAENTNATITRSFVFTQTAQTAPALAAMNVSVTHSFAGNARSANVTTSGTVNVLAQNATRTTPGGNGIGNVGGTGQPGYTIAQRITATPATPGVGAVTVNDYQDVVINFNEDVSNVRFAVSDIDRQWNATTRDFADGVTVVATNAAGVGVPVVRNTAQPNTSIVGAGTAADPYYRNVDGNISEATNAGNLAVIAAGPLRTIRIRYRNRGYLVTPGTPSSNTDNNQTIFVTGFTVDRGARLC
ncbi:MULTISPECIES: hypothetical protein [unclassified Pseudoclavibacter]|uniref:hypothetical protein n=1 Tax=unclassified Pseudoclavibacter TaxID=2615177 RepID=UPI001BA4C3C3|nr:hypothetical protein [Pseudoclavibacter sp. Marseille-Q4354]MBS3180125.1 hypothetical protein [Pseudoclavibacter sp. Marseille-Q4354]